MGSEGEGRFMASCPEAAVTPDRRSDEYAVSALWAWSQEAMTAVVAPMPSGIAYENELDGLSSRPR
jgi:hypothetical protein